MSLHEPTKAADELEALIRYGLRASLAKKLPPVDVRQRLLGRAAEQQRRKTRGLASFVSGRGGEDLARVWENAAWHHVAYFNLLRNFGVIGAPHYQIR